ncbi:tRNA lysidine(34) synthetase TilS [Anaerobacillus alkaliphilus]|uniref:tRNA(Ile)-lysidine synthase n=1 Tax=Anaerobacillus alkaliphilus TaxID=1548597 RepID=A0A4V1LGF8_9BACI|nr:tRNA lysidine(34) synthetase TilS [Anaerobacillus alkaliphilus]RXJ00925.1 tRNA lysidine(34) synthetase TilS [Anaerobacillus alkaliphilus]
MRQVVNSFINKHSLLSEGATVVVGVSGGPDSLALLHYLHKELKQLHITIIAAHVDHMLREESADEYRFVESYCLEEGITFEGTKANVKQYQETHKVSVQVAARECRYQFFELVMQNYKGHFLALAHHGDDQIETMIMRQVRGAHGYGLAGIPVKRPFSCGVLIRPFLCLSKEDILTYCKDEDLQPKIDLSNFTSKYMRNRIRNEVLPILKRENPAVHLKFQQQSELLTEDEQLLEQLAREKLEDVILKKEPKKIVLAISTLISCPISLQRRGFQLILNYLYEQNIPEITTIHMNDFLQFLNNRHPSGSLDFPNGLSITKSYDKCFLEFEKQKGVSFYEDQLLIPGIVTLKKGKIIGEVIEANQKAPITRNTMVCDKEKLKLPLIIRNRQKGDSMFINGMRGTKKLKALFIDEKVPRDERESWPIVVNGDGEILWVPKLRKANFADPTSGTKEFVKLTFEEF